MREQSHVLNHVTDASAQTNQIALSLGRRTFHPYLTCRRRQQPIDQLERCRLARTAAAQENQRLATLHLQIKPESTWVSRDPVRHVAEFNHRNGCVSLHVRPAYRSSPKNVERELTALSWSDLQYALLPATILVWKKTPRRQSGSSARPREPFAPGAVVIATLCNPREKFWGMILALAAEGLSLSGAELASFEDLAVMVRDGEPFTPAVVFFPMHRIERVELDLPDGSLPSLSQRFLAKTGLEPPPRSRHPTEISQRRQRSPHSPSNVSKDRA